MTQTATGSIALDTVETQPFDIPAGSEPVGVAYLLKGPVGRAFTLLVRFPDGWRRDVSGFYEAAEEVVVLDGRLRIGELVLDPRDWASMPAGWLRGPMRAEGEVVAFARFGGPARWRASREPTPDLVASWRHLGDPPIRLTERSRLAGRLHGAAPTDMEVLDLTRRTWTWAPAGTALPTTAGPCFCRSHGGTE